MSPTNGEARSHYSTKKQSPNAGPVVIAYESEIVERSAGECIASSWGVGSVGACVKPQLEHAGAIPARASGALRCFSRNSASRLELAISASVRSPLGAQCVQVSSTWIAGQKPNNNLILAASRGKPTARPSDLASVLLYCRDRRFPGGILAAKRTTHT